jgi:hypothetical protein
MHDRMMCDGVYLSHKCNLTASLSHIGLINAECISPNAEHPGRITEISKGSFQSRRYGKIMPIDVNGTSFVWISPDVR